MKTLRFLAYVVLGACIVALGGDKFDVESDKDIVTKAQLAIVVQPATSCDWWINAADFYRSKEDKGNVVLIGLKNVCNIGPVVVSKTITDNEIEFVTKPMGYDTEVFGYIVTDKGDNYVAHVTAKKKLKIGDVLRFKVRFAKTSIPELHTAKYRCSVDGEKRPVERFYAK